MLAKDFLFSYFLWCLLMPFRFSCSWKCNDLFHEAARTWSNSNISLYFTWFILIFFSSEKMKHAYSEIMADRPKNTFTLKQSSMLQTHFKSHACHALFVRSKSVKELFRLLSIKLMNLESLRDLKAVFFVRIWNLAWLSWRQKFREETKLQSNKSRQNHGMWHWIKNWLRWTNMLINALCLFSLNFQHCPDDTRSLCMLECHFCFIDCLQKNVHVKHMHCFKLRKHTNFSIVTKIDDYFTHNSSLKS